MTQLGLDFDFVFFLNDSESIHDSEPTQPCPFFLRKKLVFNRNVDLGPSDSGLGTKDLGPDSGLRPKDLPTSHEGEIIRNCG